MTGIPPTNRQANIVVGDGVIVADSQNGWALPGGNATQDFQEAVCAANAISEYIGSHGGRKRAVRRSQALRRAS